MFGDGFEVWLGTSKSNNVNVINTTICDNVNPLWNFSKQLDSETIAVSSVRSVEDTSPKSITEGPAQNKQADCDIADIMDFLSSGKGETNGKNLTNKSPQQQV